MTRIRSHWLYKIIKFDTPDVSREYPLEDDEVEGVPVDQVVHHPGGPVVDIALEVAPHHPTPVAGVEISR